VDFNDQYRIDTKPFTSRPYYADKVKFTDTDERFDILPCTIERLPRDVLLSNESLKYAIKLGAYYRSLLTLMISMAGTITHAGCILVGIIPPLSTSAQGTSQQTLINTLLSGPHAFLFANEATSVSLTVPWYCNSDVATLDMDGTSSSAPSTDIVPVNGNYGTLVFMVLNPLTPSDGSSKSLDIIVEAFFKSLDILVPSPKFIEYSATPPTSEGLFDIVSGVIDQGVGVAKNVIGDGIDKMRSAFKGYTGLHNPNIPLIQSRYIVTERNFTNVVDKPQFFEKLDPYVAVDRVIDNPVFNSVVDEMSLANIGSKKQLIGQFKVTASDTVGALLWSRPISPFQGGLSTDQLLISNNIELLHFLHRGWRGKIKITIQSVMNNKQQVKLKMLRLYNPSTTISTAYPKYRSILNAPSHLMEFTAGGQTQEVILDYLCRNDITPCMRDMSAEALFHGEYYIYVAQALANSGGSPESVEFNVYISLEKDFKWYGYSTELASTQPPVVLTVFESESLNVMNEPQKQTPILNDPKNDTFNSEHEDRLVSNVDIRPLLRRMYKVLTTNVTTADAAIIPLSVVVGELASGSGNFRTPAEIVSSMFYGKHLGFKFKLKLRNSVGLIARFIPPNYFVDSTSSTVLSCQPLLNPDFKENSTSANYPFTLQELPMVNIQDAGGFSQMFEFSVPNVSFYKYIGSPAKMTGSDKPYSTQDLGTVVITADGEEEFEDPILINVYAGFTDESRMGYQVIAPIIIPNQNTSNILTIYSGSLTSATSLPSKIRNKYLYFTRSV
jgi:hypothetical protein